MCSPYRQYEIIHNPHTVDLLVSLAYTAAVEGVLEEPPIGMALRVPEPLGSIIASNRGAFHAAPEATPPPPATPISVKVGADGLCDFDEMGLPEVRVARSHLE